MAFFNMNNNLNFNFRNKDENLNFIFYNSLPKNITPTKQTKKFRLPIKKKYPLKNFLPPLNWGTINSFNDLEILNNLNNYFILNNSQSFFKIDLFIQKLKIIKNKINNYPDTKKIFSVDLKSYLYFYKLNYLINKYLKENKI